MYLILWLKIEKNTHLFPRKTKKQKSNCFNISINYVSHFCDQ